MQQLSIQKETQNDCRPGKDLWAPDLQQQICSRVASINSVKPAATFRLGTFIPGTRNADIGGGRFDNATEQLAAQGVENVIYDPYNRSEEHNRDAVARMRGGQCHTATVNNVLNVIREPEIRDRVIAQAADVLTFTGVAYFLIYEGDRTGVGRVTISCRGEASVWQENRRPESYIPEIAKHFGVVTRKRNLIIATCPMKTALTFPDYQRILRALPFGKRMPKAVYVYRQALGSPLDGLISHAAAACRATEGHNLLKLREDAFRLSFLSYPKFFDDPHPALHHSISFDVETGKWTEQDFSTSPNPPILHRKETFIPKEHPRHAEFAGLTAAEEAAGLYEETSTIGMLKNWENLLAAKGLRFEGHMLVRSL